MLFNNSFGNLKNISVKSFMRLGIEMAISIRSFLSCDF